MENEITHQAAVATEGINGFMNQTFFLMPTWKWIALVLLVVGGYLLRPLLEWTLNKLKKSTKVFKDGESFLHFLLGQATEKNVSWIILCLIWLVGIDALQLDLKADKYLSLLAQIILVFHIIRFLYRSADAVGHVLRKLAAQTTSTMDDQLVPFTTKVLKFLVVVVGVLVALQNFGVNVVSILAGLGLGGLALALAAQDTAANLFGSIMILLDSPFKVGDSIKIGDTEGVVDDIGFRSTRIRTPYNSIVTIPNSTVAKERIDNMERRPQRRVRQILGLAYETPTEKIDQFCTSVKELLGKTTSVSKEGITATFMNFNAASLDVLVQFHLRLGTIEEEQAVTHKVFNEIINVAKKIGVEFAYPTQTIYLKMPEGTPDGSTSKVLPSMNQN